MGPTTQSASSSECEINDSKTSIKGYLEAKVQITPSESVDKSRKIGKSKDSNQHKVVGKDKGHRYGNFHNYYSFHPTRERMKLLEEKDGGILDYIASSWVPAQCSSTPHASLSSCESPSTGDVVCPANKKAKIEAQEQPNVPNINFRYLDVGCNEGDLTMEVAKELSCRLFSVWKSQVDNANITPGTVTVKGVDIDHVLIGRAERKYTLESAQDATTKMAAMTTALEVHPSFQVANVLSDKFEEEHYHMTSIFSTTMWIHIHGGDEGLRRVLGVICSQTKNFILIEPQPSKCYRSAMVRLRRLGLPEFDVSSERLQLRPRIEEEIDNILNSHSFQRVVDFGSGKESEGDVTGEGNREAKTTWHRSILLYQRVCSDTSRPEK